MFEVIGLIVGVLVLLALIVLLLYYAAKNKQQASFVKQGTIEFVVAGETLLEVLENIPDWHYQKGWARFPVQRIGTKDATGKYGAPTQDWELVEDAIVPDEDGPSVLLKGEIADKTRKNGPSRSSRSEKKLGFFWVSVWYPWIRIFRFLVTHLRLRPETEITKDTPLDKWLDSSVKEPAKNEKGEVISPDTTWEQSLLWRFPRPVLIREVEFADLFQANILIQGNFQIVSPRHLVFEWRERFFPLLEKALQAAAIDYLRKIPGGYQEFITQRTTGPQSEFFWEALEPLNWVGNTATSGRGLLKEFGVYLRDAWVVEIELSESDTKASDALKARKIAELEGNAEVATATKHAEAITLVATAEAGALQAQLEGSSEAILIEKLRKEAVIGNLTATTLIERGAVQIKL